MLVQWQLLKPFDDSVTRNRDKCPPTLPLPLYPYVACLALASLRVASIQRNVICTPVSPLTPPFADSLHTTTTIVVDATRRIER